MELFDEVAPGRVGSGSLPIPAAQTPAPANKGNGMPQAMVKFATADKSPQKIGRSPRVLTASIVAIGPVAGSVGVGGPLIAIAKWGSGNGSQAIAEFDVPIATGLLYPNAGQLISVVGDSLEIEVRNDANITPRDGDNTIGFAGVKVSASASIGIGNRAGSSKVTRTVYGVFQFPPAGAGLAAGDFVSMPIPSYSRSFTVFRHDDVTAAAPPVTVNQVSPFVLDGPYPFAAGIPCPEMAIIANATFVEVHNPGPATINVVGVVFNLGL